MTATRTKSKKMTLDATREIVISGQSVTQIGREVRCDLRLMYYIAQGWGETTVEAHHFLDRNGRSGWWHGAKFPTVAAASAAMDRLAEQFPNHLTLAEYMRRARGGRAA